LVGTVAPAITPVAVERRITVKPQESDLVIHGTIDLIDGPEGAPEIIRDLKTSEKAPSDRAAELSQQLSMYSLIRYAEIGRLAGRLILDYLVRTPLRREKRHVLLETTRDAEDMRVLVNRLNVAVETVKRGTFVPTSPDSWYCARAYCEYYDDCPYTRRTDRPR